MGTAALRNRRGRKRKSGHRTAAGRLIRPPEDCRLVVMAQPHRRGLGPQSGDQRLENIVGNLFFIGAISAREHEAARWYQWVVARWRAVMSVPDPATMPRAGCGGDIPTEDAQDRVKTYNAARKALEGILGPNVSVLDNTVLLNQPLPERGFRYLAAGLRKLADLRECEP